MTACRREWKTHSRCKIFIELAEHPSSSVKIYRSKNSLSQALNTVSQKIDEELEVVVAKTGNILKEKYILECAQLFCSRIDE